MTSWVAAGGRCSSVDMAGSFPVTERIQKSRSESISDSGSLGGGRSGRPGRPAPRRSPRPAPRRWSPGPGRAARRPRRPRRSTVGERVAVGAAEDQALGLDGRVDRLGDQRPGEAAAAQGAAGEGLDRGGDPLGRRGRRVGRRGDDRVDLVLGGVAEDLGEQLGLGGEVAVDGAGGDPGPRARPPRPGPRRSRRGRSARGRRRRSARARPPCAPRFARWAGRPRQEVNHGSHLVSSRSARRWPPAAGRGGRSPCRRSAAPRSAGIPTSSAWRRTASASEAS